MPPYQGGGDMISSVTFAKTTYNVLPYKFEAGTPHIAGAVGLGAALDYVEEIGRGAIAGHEQVLLDHAIERINAIHGVRRIGTARHQAAVVSFVVEDPPMAALDVGTQLDLEGIAVRTGHHCCQPLMERYEVPGTIRASLAVYNTLADVDAWADALARVVRHARGPVRASAPVVDVTYVPAAAESPQAAAEELADTFEFLEDWNTRYEYIEELGRKLPPMAVSLKTEVNRVKGCQSTVHIDLRQRPGTTDVVEFIADSDAGLVRGLIAMLEKLFSGQRACAIVAFDVQGFFRRIGLENNLVLGRRVGLAAMVERIRGFAKALAG
jgi:cysteine desulfurase/selenocysteine lyase